MTGCAGKKYNVAEKKKIKKYNTAEKKRIKRNIM